MAKSKTHRHVVLLQVNGELEEDVVHKECVESGGLASDESSDESVHGKIVGSMEIDEVPGREDPADPVPKTLPRPERD